MRNLRIIDALFPMTRQRILLTLLLDSERAWYLSDLAHHHGTSPSSLQRELASLVAAGILTKTRDGNRAYFQADVGCPVFPELRGLLVKTAGLGDQVREALAEVAGRIRLAFVYGSFASGTEKSASDVDLLVVGQVALPQLSKILKPLEARLSRSVNPSLYSEKEFRAKLDSGQRFLTKVVNGPKIFIVGNELELADLTDGGAGKTTGSRIRKRVV